jgi:hypothetical protein
MKAVKLSLLALLIVPTLFVACKKDSGSPAPVPTNSIEGVWQGKYGYGNEAPSISYIFNIKPGGVIEELNASGNSKGSGTWTLVGTTFTAKYQWKAPLLTIFSVTSTFDKSTSKLTGLWGYDNNNSNGGKWTMTKKSN